MNEIIHVKNENGELLVSARDLHKGLELSKRFSSWIEQYIKENNKYGFEQNIDFTSVLTSTVVNNGASRELQDYAIKIDMAKEICMITANEKGKQFRKYFIECEKQLKCIVPQLTRKEQLQLQLFSKDSMVVVNAHNELVAMEVEKATKPLVEKIEEYEPKVAFADRILKDGKNILVRELAKVSTDEGFKIGEKKLYNQLREWGYILKYSTEPTQYAMDRGLFVVESKIIETVYGDKQVFTTKVTPKGQIHIVEKLLKKIIVNN